MRSDARARTSSESDARALTPTRTVGNDAGERERTGKNGKGLERVEVGRREQHRLQVERLQDLSDRLRRGERVTARSLAAAWEVSTKTVYRDIEFLRDRQHAPIEYVPERQSYVLEDRTWSLGALELTEGELLELALAQRVAAQYEGTSLGDTLQGLFEKIRAALPDVRRVDPIEIRSEFSFHGQPARPVNRRTWTTLARAVRECRAVEADYWSREHDRTSSPTLEPLHLANLEGDWYLAARWRPHRDPAILAVSRFRRARLTRQTFDRGDFDPAQYFANRFGRFVRQPGADDEIVARIRFKPHAAPDALERTWHPRQEIEKHADGSVTLTLPFPTSYIAERWVRQWGDDVECLAPEWLRVASGAGG